MPRSSAGGSMRVTTLRMSGRLYDRIVNISVRLNLSISEVILRLMIAGLDTTQDLALDEPAKQGMAVYVKRSTDSRDHSISGSGDSVSPDGDSAQENQGYGAADYAGRD